MKNIINQALLACSLVLTVSCGSIQDVIGGGDSFPKVDKPSHRKPKPTAKVYKPTGEWIIKSVDDLKPLEKLGAKITEKNSIITVDLKGLIIDGSRQKGSGGQGENQTPLFRAQVPLVMQNGHFQNNKNAATWYKPNGGAIDITLVNIGEDGIATSDGAKNFLVRNCEFIGGKSSQDKLLQLNEADGAKIENNLFYGSITGVRVAKIDYSSRSDRAFCGNNKFIAVDTAWGVAKITLEVERKNSYEKVRIPFKINNGAKIKNADGQVEQN